MKHLTAPHSFEGIPGIKGRHRLAELNEVELADGLGQAIQETLEKASGGMSEHQEAGLANLLEASFTLHYQLSYHLAMTAQTFPS